MGRDVIHSLFWREPEAVMEVIGRRGQGKGRKIRTDTVTAI